MPDYGLQGALEFQNLVPDCRHMTFSAAILVKVTTVLEAEVWANSGGVLLAALCAKTTVMLRDTKQKYAELARQC